MKHKQRITPNQASVLADCQIGKAAGCTYVPCIPLALVHCVLTPLMRVHGVAGERWF